MTAAESEVTTSELPSTSYGCVSCQKSMLGQFSFFVLFTQNRVEFEGLRILGSALLSLDLTSYYFSEF